MGPVQKPSKSSKIIRIEITSQEAVNFRNKFFDLYKGVKR
jgi:hypothetical protein